VVLAFFLVAIRLAKPGSFKPPTSFDHWRAQGAATMCTNFHAQSGAKPTRTRISDEWRFL